MGFDRLIEKIAATQNPTVAGLDPKLDYVPASIKNACFEKYGKTLEGAAAALLAFNKAIISFPPSSRRRRTMRCTAGRA